MRPMISKATPTLLLDFSEEATESEILGPYWGDLEDYRSAILLIYAGSRRLIIDIERQLSN